MNWYLSRPQKGTIGVKHTTSDCGKTTEGKKLNVGLDRQTQQLVSQITELEYRFSFFQVEGGILLHIYVYMIHQKTF